MDLRQLQRDAWQCAEEKGHHKNLNGVMFLGKREQALLALVPVYQAVTDLTQEIKRHGVYDMGTLHHYQDSIIEAVTRFNHNLRLLQDKQYVDPNNKMLATAIRLMLVHTEVDEAAEASLSSLDTITRLVNLGKELADIAIRLFELAEDCGLDMDEWVSTVMRLNRERPYGYGTPTEHKG
jgi:hypothetical protein